MNLRSAWTRYRSWTAAQRRVFWRASFELPLAWLRLQRHGAEPLRARLASAAPPGAPLPLDELVATASIVNAAARRSPFPVTCLTRSIVLQDLLRERGAACDLRIGVQLAGGTLAAHAWVESAGTPLNDAPDVASRFAPFAPLSPHVPLPAFPKEGA